MIRHAQIFEGDVCVALLVHDDRVGRVVFKGDPYQPVYAGLLPHWEHPIVTYDAHRGAIIRRMVMPYESNYLAILLRKTIHAPYRSGQIKQGPTTRLDEAANDLAETLLPSLALTMASLSPQGDTHGKENSKVRVATVAERSSRQGPRRQARDAGGAAVECRSHPMVRWGCVRPGPARKLLSCWYAYHDGRWK